MSTQATKRRVIPDHYHAAVVIAVHEGALHLAPVMRQCRCRTDPAQYATQGQAADAAQAHQVVVTDTLAEIIQATAMARAQQMWDAGVRNPSAVILRTAN